jgi:hypothetical protein
MKLIAQLIVGCIAALLLLLARGAMLKPDEVAVGLVIHFAAIVLLFVFLFYWRSTSLRTPRAVDRHRSILKWLYFVLGVVVGLAIISLLFMGSFGGDIGKLIVSLRLASPFDALLGLFLSSAALLVTYGLHTNKTWADTAAKVVAFPISLGWPVGLALAVYTWWSLNPNRDVELAGVSQNQQ